MFERITKRKKIIDSLRRGPKRHKDLIIESGLPQTTVDRILREFEIYGLFEKRVDGRWAWFEHVRHYKTAKELEMFADHSKQLISALEALLAEEEDLWLPQEWKHAENIEQAIMEKHTRFAEEHLRTGYPEMFDKLTKLRVSILRFKDAGVSFHDWREKDPEQVLQSENPSQERKLELKDFFALYQELSGDIRTLILRIKAGEPLNGMCSLCPKVKVGE